MGAEAGIITRRGMRKKNDVHGVWKQPDGQGVGRGDLMLPTLVVKALLQGCHHQVPRAIVDGSLQVSIPCLTARRPRPLRPKRSPCQLFFSLERSDPSTVAVMQPNVRYA